MYPVLADTTTKIYETNIRKCYQVDQIRNRAITKEKVEMYQKTVVWRSGNTRRWGILCQIVNLNNLKVAKQCNGQGQELQR